MSKVITKNELNAVIKTMDGEDMHYHANPRKEPVKLLVRLALRVALTSENPREQVDGDTKFIRFATARRIYEANNTVELSDEEFEQAMKCVGFVWGPEVVGWIYEKFAYKKTEKK